jgi:hypothetical protein
MIKSNDSGLPATSVKLFAQIEGQLAQAAQHNWSLYATDRNDDEEQPEAFGVWIEGPEGLDLYGTGNTLDEALADTLKTVASWTEEP